MSDDAEFDAFLKGEGELSRQLQSVPQPSPSAELDAAILNRVKQDLAREGRPRAANDAGDDVPAPRLARGLGPRWRIPAGIAATVLVGVFAKQSFMSDTEGRFESIPQETAVADAVVVQQAPEAPAKLAEQPAAAMAPVQDSEQKERARRRPVPAPALELSPPPPPPSAPAPVPEVAAAAPPTAAAPVAVAAAARKATAAAAQERAMSNRSQYSAEFALRTGDDWAAEIEKLLVQDRKAEALAEWKKFREAYPSHEVSPELESQIVELAK